MFFIYKEDLTNIKLYVLYNIDYYQEISVFKKNPICKNYSYWIACGMLYGENVQIRSKVSIKNNREIQFPILNPYSNDCPSTHTAVKKK